MMKHDQLKKFDDRLKTFGSRFEDRMPKEIIDDALSYSGYGERQVALRMLIEHLLEYEASISTEEYAEAKDLCELTSQNKITLDDLEQLAIRQ